MSAAGRRAWILASCLSLCAPLAPAQARDLVYFSPHGGCSAAVLQLVSQAQHRLDVAVYSIGSPAIAQALIDAQARGVHVRILTDHTQAGVHWPITQKLAAAGLEFRLHSVGRIMHNKFAIADGTRLTTGSFNWTRAAEDSNAENCLLIDDAQVVGAFEVHFAERLWARNGATRSAHFLRRLLARHAGQTPPERRAEAP